MDIDFLPILQDITQFNPTFHQLFDKRTVILNEEISDSIIESVVLPLLDFEKDEKEDPVTLILNTPGGSLADGLVLCNIIDNYKKRLNIIVPSYSCSMGTIILCAGNNNSNVTKKCYDFSFALFHSGQTFLSGESASVDDVVDFNRKTEKKVKEYIVKNTKITEELYQQHYRKQWYLTSKEMLEYGLVNEIIGSD